VILAPAFSHRPTEALAGPQRLVSDDSPLRGRLPRPGIFTRRYDRIGLAVGDGVMALAGIVSAIFRDRSDLLIGRNLRQQFGEHNGVTNACTSSVSASIARWSLSQRRRLEGPCLRACHSPSLSTLIPVLSIRRCIGPGEMRRGRTTASPVSGRSLRNRVWCYARATHRTEEVTRFCGGG